MAEAQDCSIQTIEASDDNSMSSFGVPPEISALQASQAQREAATAKDRQRAVREQRRGGEELERLFRVNETEDVAEIHRFEEERDKHDRSRRRTETPRVRSVDEDHESGGGNGSLDITA